ncbi:MAG TPA: hypothetical protein VK528_13610 [Flavobacterium sp.]|nr:hypothetical protein [Flavobacterium sp.]
MKSLYILFAFVTFSFVAAEKTFYDKLSDAAIALTDNKNPSTALGRTIVIY